MKTITFKDFEKSGDKIRSCKKCGYLGNLIYDNSCHAICLRNPSGDCIEVEIAEGTFPNENGLCPFYKYDWKQHLRSQIAKL